MIPYSTPDMKSLRTLRRTLSVLCATALVQAGLLSTSHAQVAPGPYEFLPFEDGFIFEAFFDLEQSSDARADWSGWSGTTWVSPNAYNNHTGTDIALQTGTPLYALAAGEVVAIENSIPQNDHSLGGHGNYVMIRLDEPTPNGDQLDVIYAHMLSVSATVGQRVAVGDLVGFSDNTGNSTSEHLHIQSEINDGTPQGPLYWGHFKYPIVFNITGTTQLGHVVRVTAESTTVHTDRFAAPPVLGTVHRGQLYFASYAKRGFYQIFLPNNPTRRSGWIRADHVEEVYTGTVIQPLPDPVPYNHSTQLTNFYTIRSAPDDGAEQIGQIYFGGGRFVAREISNGYYKIPVPGEAAVEGWVRADDRMIVYPDLYHPDIKPELIPYKEFPIVESFSAPGKSLFGRAKFTRGEVREFSPASPGGDGYALFITDANNSGNGLTESVLAGKPEHRNYYVQCDVYFNFQPAYLNERWERYGIFIRDDGFAGMSHAFEGGGNGYCLVWDSDDGRIRAGRFQDALVSNFMAAQQYIEESGWHTLRIEVRESNIRYFLDDTLLIEVEDSTFTAGPCGIGYYWNSSGYYPPARGAYFDNFVADTLDPVPLGLSDMSVGEDDVVTFRVHSDVGSTTRIERADSLTVPDNWELVGDMPQTLSVLEVEDDASGTSKRFYRATRLDPE